MSIATAVWSRIGSRTRSVLAVLALLGASLALGFVGAVVWDVAGRVITVRTDRGKVEVDLSPREAQARR